MVGFNILKSSDPARGLAGARAAGARAEAFNQAGPGEYRPKVANSAVQRREAIDEDIAGAQVPVQNAPHLVKVRESGSQATNNHIGFPPRERTAPETRHLVKRLCH